MFFENVFEKFFHMEELYILANYQNKYQGVYSMFEAINPAAEIFSAGAFAETFRGFKCSFLQWIFIDKAWITIITMIIHGGECNENCSDLSWNRRKCRRKTKIMYESLERSRKYQNILYQLSVCINDAPNVTTLEACGRDVN